MELKTKQVNEVAQPLSQGEKTFKGFHNPVKAEKLVPGVTDQDHVFKGSTKPMDNKFKNGYKPPQDVDAYDKNLTIDPSKNPIGHEKPTVGEGVVSKIGKAVAGKVAHAVLSNILSKDTSNKILKGDKKQVKKEDLELSDEDLISEDELEEGGKKNWPKVHRDDRNYREGGKVEKKSLKPFRQPGEESKSEKRAGLSSIPGYKEALAKRGLKEAEDITDEELFEALTKSAKASDWIHDFVHSDNPKFKGKSTKERQKMALAAYYAKQNEEVEHVEEDLDTLGPESKIKDNKHHNSADYINKNEKIAKIRNKQIDSLKNSVKEQFVSEDHDEYDYEGEMAKAELRAMCDKADQLANMLSDDQQLEAWLQSKISRAKDYIDAVYDYMMYRDKKPAAAAAPMPSQAPMADTYGSFLNRMGEEVEQVDEKSLAALAPPKDKVTKKDILVGRGVLKKHPKDPDKHVLAKEEAKKGFKLDPVGKEDSDIDNDGDVDKSDSYLHNRRKAIKSNMKKESALEDMIGNILGGYINKVSDHYTVKPTVTEQQVNEGIEDHPEFTEQELEAFKQIMKDDNVEQ